MILRRLHGEFGSTISDARSLSYTERTERLATPIVMSMLETAPPVGRRVLVAVVDGDLGQRIQRWRLTHDARHAERLPPHLTVCYRPPVDIALARLEQQVRHAFPSSVTVKLGPLFVLGHPEAPLAVSIHATDDLDNARRRLFDRTYAPMGGRDDWPWHITCIRYGAKRDRAALLALARSELALDAPWTIDALSYLELRDGRYEPVAVWELTSSD